MAVADDEHGDAIEAATVRLLRLAALLGLTSSVVALFTTLAQGFSIAVLLAVVWTAAWTVAAMRPQIIGSVLRPWLRTTPIIAGLSAATILVSGGFDSLLKTEANWLAWAAPIALGTAASIAVASMLSTGLLIAFMLNGMSLEAIASGPDRYTAVTDILNPVVIVLLSLAVTGVFRFVLANAVTTLRRARDGDYATSPAMFALLAGEPVLALPAGEFAAIEDRAERPLSPAERDILDRLAAGQTPQQIALARGVRDDTVYDQIGSAKRKFGATTIEHLVALAWRPQS